MAKTWTHGDVPVAADMNEYSTDLSALHAATPAYNAIPCVLVRANDAAAGTNPQNDWNTGARWSTYAAPTVGGQSMEFEYRIRHTKRYLHFKGSGGKIADVAGIEPDVTLSPGSNGVGVVDLDSVTWLVYGQWYKVQRVDAAWELDDA